MRTIILLTPTIWLLFFIGCGTSTQTRIEDRTFVLPVPAIHDSIIVRVDTLVIEGEKIVLTDTVFAFKYFPAEKKVVYVVRPDSIRFVVRDTVTVYQDTKNPEKHSFFWFVGFVIVIMACTAGVYGLYKIMGIVKI